MSSQRAQSNLRTAILYLHFLNNMVPKYHELFPDTHKGGSMCSKTLTGEGVSNGRFRKRRRDRIDINTDTESSTERIASKNIDMVTVTAQTIKKKTKKTKKN